MRRLSRTICGLVVLLAAGVVRAGPVASLVTVGPGDEVWERFGHNMIRIEDSETGFDVCYNWGIFDFRQPNFVGNFVRGRMLYAMRPFYGRDARAELDEYRRQDRRVVSQRLNLTPEQLRALYLRCEFNALPANADYRYDYFKDNCSTRVRDMLDGVTGGPIRRVTAGKATDPPVTFRHEAVRLIQGDFWASLGLDFAAGPSTNKPLDAWAECFLPAAVSGAAEDAGVAGPPVDLWPTTRPPPPAALPTRWPGLLAVGLAVAAVLRFTRPRVRIWVAGAWWAVSGFGGAFLLYLWTFTDHTAGYANQNLWHYSPLAWAALGLLVLRRRRAAFRVAVAVAAVSIVGVGVWAVGRLGGPFAQPNGGFILLALPIDLAAAWAGRPALTKAPAADDMAA